MQSKKSYHGSVNPPINHRKNQSPQSQKINYSKPCAREEEKPKESERSTSKEVELDSKYVQLSLFPEQ